MANKVVLIFVGQCTEIGSFKKLENDAILKPRRNTSNPAGPPHTTQLRQYHHTGNVRIARRAAFLAHAHKTKPQ